MPKLLETFDQLIRSSEIRSSDPLSPYPVCIYVIIFPLTIFVICNLSFICRNGEGIQIWKDGTLYIGDFQNNQLHVSQNKIMKRMF